MRPAVRDFPLRERTLADVLVRFTSFRRLRAAAFLAVGCLSDVLLVGPARAESETSEQREAFTVGTRLFAIDNVSLHEAQLTKGSSVSITKLGRLRGKLEFVDLELADGHVVTNVAMRTVRSYFRVSVD